MSENLTYSSYLNINNILNQQIPLSESPHEELFIIVHQVSELWFKLIINNINQLQNHINKDEKEEGIKVLDKIISIQEQLNNVWDVLAELSPADYLTFRNYLGESSGFQSFQYRFLEFKLGKKNEKFLELYKDNSDEKKLLNNALQEKSLYDLIQEFIIRNSKYNNKYYFKEACKEIYRFPKDDYIIYILLEKIIAIDGNFKEWRFKHMNTVQKVIGMKKGTGGSKGVNYLKKIVDYEFFPEIWEIRTEL